MSVGEMSILDDLQKTLDRWEEQISGRDQNLHGNLGVQTAADRGLTSEIQREHGTVTVQW